MEYEAGSSPEPVWTVWRTEKYLVPTWIRTSDRPARSKVGSGHGSDIRRSPTAMARTRGPACPRGIYDELSGTGTGSSHFSPCQYYSIYAPHSELLLTEGRTGEAWVPSSKSYCWDQSNSFKREFRLPLRCK
jgi:hypothetical protein